MFDIGSVSFPWFIFEAVGLSGFLGEGYWYHRFIRRWMRDGQEMNRSFKTTTMDPRTGNMPLGKNGISPRDHFPRCIMVEPWSGHVLNAVGLSGPGAPDLLGRGIWQNLAEPFSLSFMAVGQTREQREREYLRFRDYLAMRIDEFRSRFILQLNFGCPNAEVSLEEIRDEGAEALRIMNWLPGSNKPPLVCNFNPLVPVELLQALEETGLCAGFWIANTIPYDHDGLGERTFGSRVSPMTKRGFSSAGGISGPSCLPYTLAAVERARKSEVKVPIVAGNGIRKPADVQALKDVGANAVTVGSVAMVRPWDLPAVVTYANQIFRE